jgi:hypothetical protein
MTLDLARLVPIETGVAMELRHPESGEVVMNGKGPVTISLVGEDAEVYRQALHEQLNRRFNVRNKRGAAPVTAEQLETDAVDLLVTATVGWSGIVFDGAELPCTPENARMVYGKLRWLRGQVESFIQDRSNFFEKSKTT